MYDFVLEGRSELRPNCELPHHQGLRVLTFPSVDSKLSLPIMLRAQTLTFDEQAPVSIKVPHERHHRGEIAAGWVCGRGLRSFRTRAKVFSDAG